MSAKWLPKARRKASMPVDYKCREELEEESDVSRITERLFLSGQHGTNCTEFLQQLGVTHILTLGTEGPLSPRPDLFAYATIKKEDLTYEDLLSSLEEAILFIGNSSKCLVHCHKGISRSPAVVVAYLMAKEGRSLQSALEWVQKCRPAVNPNWGFRRQLRLFEAMGCKAEGPLYEWYQREVAGSMTLHPDLFTNHPDVSVDPALYVDPADLDRLACDGPVFGCRACRRVLATPLHVLGWADPQAVMVERLHWMAPRRDLSGPLEEPALGHDLDKAAPKLTIQCPNGHPVGFDLPTGPWLLLPQLEALQHPPPAPEPVARGSF